MNVVGTRQIPRLLSGSPPPQLSSLSDLDELDIRLLAEIEGHPRESASALALKVGTSVNTVLNRLSRLINRGALVTTIWPRAAAFGFPFGASVGISARPRHVYSVASALSAHPQVEAVKMTSGRYDCVVTLSLRDLDDLFDFTGTVLGGIEGITNHDTMIWIRFLKERSAILTDAQEDSPPPKPASVVFDDMDLKIMMELDRDCRADIKPMAERLGISRSTAKSRIDRLLKAKAFSVVAAVNPACLGLTTRAILLLRVEPAKIASVGHYLGTCRESRYVIAVSGRHSVIAQVLCRDLAGLKEFTAKKLAGVPGIVSIETLIYDVSSGTPFFESRLPKLISSYRASFPGNMRQGKLQ